jgi:hypothetical protein
MNEQEIINKTEIELNNRSGIVLTQLEVDNVTYEVVRTLAYVPWNFGKINPGAGQLGVYELEDSSGKKAYVLIKDYRSAEGNWKVILVGKIHETEQQLKHVLQVDPFGLCLMEYLFM